MIFFAPLQHTCNFFVVKAASIDPRSPGGQDLTRTPIVLKNQDNDTTEKENGIKGLGKNEDVTPKPKRGMAAFVDKLVESTEIEVS